MENEFVIKYPWICWPMPEDACPCLDHGCSGEEVCTCFCHNKTAEVEMEP